MTSPRHSKQPSWKHAYWPVVAAYLVGCGSQAQSGESSSIAVKKDCIKDDIARYVEPLEEDYGEELSQQVAPWVTFRQMLEMQYAATVSAKNPCHGFTRGKGDSAPPIVRVPARSLLEGAVERTVMTGGIDFKDYVPISFCLDWQNGLLISRPAGVVPEWPASKPISDNDFRVTELRLILHKDFLVPEGHPVPEVRAAVVELRNPSLRAQDPQLSFFRETLEGGDWVDNPVAGDAVEDRKAIPLQGTTMRITTEDTALRPDRAPLGFRVLVLGPSFQKQGETYILIGKARFVNQ